MGYFEEELRVINSSIQSMDMEVFGQAVEECIKTAKSGHKIIASGLGKNVPVCEKFVGSLLSLGIDAAFLHTNSAVHGDMGAIRMVTCFSCLLKVVKLLSQYGLQSCCRAGM